MQSFHFTSDPNIDAIIFFVGALVCLYWLRALRLAREGARLFLRNLLKAVVVFCFSVVILTVMRTQTNLSPSQEQVVAAIVAFVFFVRWQSQKRSRYTSTSVKRAVIARDLKGEKYDGKKHHIDHVWPFARGGSHTTDNLRVIEKKKNLKKGAKRRRIWEMW